MKKEFFPVGTQRGDPNLSNSYRLIPVHCQMKAVEAVKDKFNCFLGYCTVYTQLYTIQLGNLTSFNPKKTSSFEQNEKCLISIQTMIDPANDNGSLTKRALDLS